ncbi:MAG TPA: hypothetical protein VKE94_15635, partial [Gemmataceae bacterium]|nr:hypothetical protein [Gemmataceae bacterium]
MPTSCEKRQRGNGRRAAALAFSLLAAGGCAGDGRSKGDDPLAGGGPPIPTRAATAATSPSRGADASATT